MDSTGAKNPVQISNGNAVLSNKQTTRHLLCTECEQRFSKCEDYVARLTEPDNGVIRLFRSITRPSTPKMVLASLNNRMDGEQIAYFAASVIWRGYAVTGDCKLGPYEQKFRHFLLGETEFPTEVVISVGLFDLSPNVDARGWVSEPVSIKTKIGWLHGFLLAGLAFRCWVGKGLPPLWQQVSLTGPNPYRYVSIIKPEGCADFMAAAEMAGNAKHRGKLAKSQLGGSSLP